VSEPRWKRTAYWRDLPRWKQALLEVGNEEAFVVRYFSHRIDELKDFHLRLIGTALNEARGLILYPAGHGKTTLADTVLTLLEVCRNPDIRILIIAKNDEEANSIGQLLQAEMVDNQLLIADFGPFKPAADSDKPWALGRMVVAGRTKMAKEATFLVVGWNAKTVLGYRTDWTICDDVVTDENSASPTQRAKMRDRFDLAVETGPQFFDSRLTVVGTRFDPHDLYGDLREMQQPTDDGEGLEAIWTVQHEDAIVDENRQISLWPEVWPWKRLMQTKTKVGTLSFNKRYRNIAVDSSRMVVKEEHVVGGWIGNLRYPGCLDHQHTIGYHGDDWRIVAGFDPAGGKSKAARFCAHMTVAAGSCKEHERCLWVVDLERGQWTHPQQVELILRKHQQYGLLMSVVEANTLQIGLHESLQQKMDDLGVAYAIEPHYTTRHNKPDPELGVQAMAPWFEQGKVHIPWGDAHSQRVMQLFIDELVQYPDGRTSDTVMAFWFAWLQLQGSATQAASWNRVEAGRTALGRGPLLGRRVIQNPVYRKAGAV
jgi:hypothetical protein